MTVTIDISADMEKKLREEAARHGQDLPAYIQQILASQVAQGVLPARSDVMEMHGIGKATWQGVDVEKYITAERDEWDKAK